MNSKIQSSKQSALDFCQYIHKTHLNYINKSSEHTPKLPIHGSCFSSIFLIVDNEVAQYNTTENIALFAWLISRVVSRSNSIFLLQ